MLHRIFVAAGTADLGGAFRSGCTEGFGKSRAKVPKYLNRSLTKIAYPCLSQMTKKTVMFDLRRLGKNLQQAFVYFRRDMDQLLWPGPTESDSLFASR